MVGIGVCLYDMCVISSVLYLLFWNRDRPQKKTYPLVRARIRYLKCTDTKIINKLTPGPVPKVY
jgi:hypothetical protein